MASKRESTVQVAFRFPAGMLERLDARIAEEVEENPGRSFSRADLVRQFVFEGLEALAHRGAGAAKRKAKKGQK